MLTLYLIDIVSKVWLDLEQLIQLIFKYLVANAMLVFPHKLNVTGKDPVQLQIFNGLISCCKNLQTSQEEAGTIIIHHLVAATKAIIVANGTKIFVLLLHFTFTGDVKSRVYMQPTDKESSAHIMDKAITYQRHIEIMPTILVLHGLSGCDTICSYFVTGKKTVINVLNKKNTDLSLIGFLHEPLENYLKQGIKFLLHCYGQYKVETLNDPQKKMWKYSFAKSKLGAPKLESLPPTDNSFFQNLKRRHLQIAARRYSLNADPPAVDIDHCERMVRLSTLFLYLLLQMSVLFQRK